MDMLTQLNKAMAYVEEHIENDLALANVSSVTVYSPYHFGRLFYYVAEVPLSEYIRKRKLSLAGMKLQSGEVKVIDLAVLYGYDSADSFTRAFVKQHGITPSSARRKGVNLTIFPPLTFQIKIQGAKAMNWRIEEKEAFEVFGLERIFGRADINSGKVPMFWTDCHNDGSFEKLYDAAGGKRDPDGRPTSHTKEGMCLINAICDYRDMENDNFPYMICAFKKADTNTDGYVVATVPKATWAVFRSDNFGEGLGKEVPKLFGRAYSEWLPTSGYDRATGPDMEFYYHTADGNFYEEVWLPVVKKSA